MEKIKQLGRHITGLYHKLIRKVKLCIYNIILKEKINYAKYLWRRSGTTQYVIQISWRDIRILDKTHYHRYNVWLRKYKGCTLKSNLICTVSSTVVNTPKGQKEPL